MNVADFATELDAPQGFEPRSSDSESDILPLDDRAVMFSVFLIIYTEYQA